MKAEQLARERKMMEEQRQREAEKDRIQDLKNQGIYNVKKFNTISGRGDIYPCACQCPRGGTWPGYYSSKTKVAYFLDGGSERTTTNYTILKNWSKSTSRSGGPHTHHFEDGKAHCVVLPTVDGDVVGAYNITHNWTWGVYGSTVTEFKGHKGVIFINGTI